MIQRRLPPLVPPSSNRTNHRRSRQVGHQTEFLQCRNLSCQSYRQLELHRMRQSLRQIPLACSVVDRTLLRHENRVSSYDKS